jgi:hypothetical protein
LLHCYAGNSSRRSKRSKIDAALPAKAPPNRKKPRRMLVISLAKVQDRIVRGHPAIPAATYALEQMGQAHRRIRSRVQQRYRNVPA